MSKRDNDNNTFERLDMQSPDLVSENIAKIQALFPNCVTEAADGLKIDFELLKQELSKDIVEGRKERYRLEWPGKRESLLMANTPTNKTLRPIREDSADFDNTENVYIEGDNLEVLKLLQGSYHGKVKMIYIDPPYNTGKDFVYSDKFAQDKSEYEAESGQVDEEGNRLFLNKETNGRYHSDWLNMLYPRLKIARNLMREDAAIFISIDDNEVHNLKKICDEIFGEVNFINNLIWEKKYTVANDAKYFSDNHDHILMYVKNKDKFSIGRLPRTDQMNAAYKNPDNHKKGPWKATPLQAKSGSDTNFKHIFKNGISWSPPKGRYSAYSSSRLDELFDNNELWFGVKGDSTPSRKTFLSELKHKGVVPRTILTYKEAGHNHESILELKELFEANIFDNPKPTKLIKLLCLIADIKGDDVFLDFFSGSASSAHALMHFNNIHKSSVKYVQIQLPESTNSKSEAKKAGYHNICEIGKERIRRAAQKIKEETGADIDYGFRVYQLDDSNMNDVYYLPQDYEQGKIQSSANNIKMDRTAEDLLTQIILDWGLPLSLPIEQAEIGGKKVYKVAGDSLFACFDADISESFAEAVAEYKPHRLVFKDNSFSSNNAKINMKQVLMQLCPETEVKVI